ncbi:MAG: DUF2062 domain-containing protein [Acidiferrobacterales bacterium]|jgi:uncharacterized protein (DUF2062 family)|nr:DUF2062 domain-containing protein [Acidiferrobacterales bacterium]
MARKFIKRYMPDVHIIRNHRHLKIFGRLLHDANLWHLNRHSVSTAFAIGLFMACMPTPFQMLPAALLAIWFRANLPISVTLVWVSNPVTMPPLFYFCYKLGNWILQTPPEPFTFAFTLEWFWQQFLHDWQPFLLGCVVVGAALGALGYGAIRALWRWQVVRAWQARKDRRLAAKQKTL